MRMRGVLFGALIAAFGVAPAGADDVVISAEEEGTATEITIVDKTGNSSEFKLLPKALSSVCRSVRSLTRGEIWKSIASRHITDGRRKNSTSFITNRGTRAPSGNCILAYDSGGTIVHKLGRYFPTGAAYSSRSYGGAGCGDGRSARAVATTAQRNTGSPSIFLQMGGGVCARIPNPVTCYNSSGC